MKGIIFGLVLLPIAASASDQTNSTNPSAPEKRQLKYFVSPMIGAKTERESYYLIKAGGEWKASKTGDLGQDSVERISVNLTTGEIRLSASAPSNVSKLEQDRGPGRDNKWECYQGVGGNGYRTNTDYSICSSNLTKGVTNPFEATIGSLNLLLGSVRRMMAVDQEAVMAAAESSGLLDMVEQERNAMLATAAKREQEKLDADRKAEDGDANAKYQRGLDYLNSASWNAEAQRWFEKAAAAGSADALFKLGVFYNDHYHNEIEAEGLWKKAAQGGNIAAKNALKDLAAERNRRTEQLVREREQLVREREQINAERGRINVFRKSLAEGSETNCGPVIEVKPKLIKVAYPVANYGGEHWIRRDRIFPSGYGCRFFNGEYQPPQ